MYIHVYIGIFRYLGLLVKSVTLLVVWLGTYVRMYKLYTSSVFQLCHMYVRICTYKRMYICCHLCVLTCVHTVRTYVPLATGNVRGVCPFFNQA